MIKRTVLGATVLAAAVGGPVAYYQATDYLGGAVPQAAASAGGAEQATDPAIPAVPDTPAAPAAPSVAGPPVADLAEVLRFDVTPRWVMERWPRVSTGLADMQLEGYRVPLVTGTGATDLAGALTYYFDPEQRVQRITFRGTTGDVRKLAHLLVTRYRFSRRLTNDPGVIVYEAVDSLGRLASIARFHVADVVRSSAPHHTFRVELVIERPA